jgi:hypothetical protein
LDQHYEVAAIDSWAADNFIDEDYFKNEVRPHLESCHWRANAQWDTLQIGEVRPPPQDEPLLELAAGQTQEAGDRVRLLIRVAREGRLHAVDFQILKGKNGPSITLGEPWQVAQDVAIVTGRGVAVKGTFIPLLTDEQVEMWLNQSEGIDLYLEAEAERKQYFGQMCGGSTALAGAQASRSEFELLPVITKSGPNDFNINPSWVKRSPTAAQAVAPFASEADPKPDPYFQTTLTLWSSKARGWGQNIWRSIRRLMRSVATIIGDLC